ncbi:MAG: hypothetical protein AVDCRST_MAG34-1463 [uncultured Nocardioidaceae bacterium]|uniref:Uncharacterized protein n=1 Tax=uncultured Nocardioidaceae bacterium TaxID=253824 RepID=A0A6J4L3N3_9ACTN|nr:MAG: hypothetical protein AVDCRST_MAG34-1463 [uncultured Nocardioidaceae bacterium]
MLVADRRGVEAPGSTSARRYPDRVSRLPRRRVQAAATGPLATLAVALVTVLALVPAPVAADPAPVTASTQGHAPRLVVDPVEAARAAPLEPLKLVIEELTPSVVPTRGRVTVSGFIRNRSADRWTDLSVYLFTSADPMTSRDEVAAGVASDPRTQVGDRIVAPGTFVEVPDLDPGASTDFRLSVPRDQLGISGEPGVYWLGVHVLGTSSEGRLEGADGRARTFLPLVPSRNQGTRLALGLQLRDHVVRGGDGALAFPENWAERLTRSGRLRRLVELGSSTTVPFTWLIDPAVLEAVRSMARGNPPLQLGQEPDGEDGGDVPPDDTGDGTGDGTGESATDGTSADTTTTSPSGATVEADATAWLARFDAATAGRPVLGLPYGDLDLSAAVGQGLPGLVTAALDLSSTLLRDTALEAEPVVVPPDGALDPAALELLDPDVGILLGNGAVRPHTAGGGPVLDREDGGRVLVAPTSAEVEGPGPGSTRSAIAVRQRLLADAALQALSGRRDQPLVRLLPAVWDPGPAWRRADFFRGLDVPWLTGVRLTDLLASPGPRPGSGSEPASPVVSQADLVYPPESAEAELPAGTLLATQSLVDEGLTLEEVLTDTSTVDDQLTRQALEASSVWSRFHPGLAEERARAATSRVRSWLSRVEVTSPSFVTMSSENGTFQVTLVNGLDETVTVGLRTTVTGEGLRITTPAAVQLPPDGRVSLRIRATASDIGVHAVTLQPVSPTGTAVGAPARLSVRSSQVGAILWIAMAVGAALLFSAIAVRIWRRIRQRRRTHGPLLKPGAA